MTLHLKLTILFTSTSAIDSSQRVSLIFRGPPGIEKKCKGLKRTASDVRVIFLITLGGLYKL